MDGITPKKTINSADFVDCLFEILCRIPLNDVLVNANLVCTKWYCDIVPKVCRTKRRLKICTRPFISSTLYGTYMSNTFGPPAAPAEPPFKDFKDNYFKSETFLPSYRNDTLVVKTDSLKLSRGRVAFMTDTFPNINNLSLFKTDSICRTFRELVTVWPRLSSLTIIIRKRLHDVRGHDSDGNHALLWQHVLEDIFVEYSESLKKLWICDDGSMPGHAVRVPITIPMACLEMLNLGLWIRLGDSHKAQIDHFGVVFPRLTQVAFNQYLSRDPRQTDLGNRLNVKHFLQSAPIFKRRQITHFSMFGIYEYVEPELSRLELCSWLNENLVDIRLSIISPIYEFLIRSGFHQLPNLRNLWLYRNNVNSYNHRPGLLSSTRYSPKNVVYQTLTFLYLPIIPHFEFDDKWPIKAAVLLPRVETVRIACRRGHDENYLNQCRAHNDRHLCESQDVELVRSLASLPALKEVWFQGRVVAKGDVPKMASQCHDEMVKLPIKARTAAQANVRLNKIRDNLTKHQKAPVKSDAAPSGPSTSKDGK